MKYFIRIVLVFLPNFLLAQNNFKIELIAPTFENDSLYVGPPSYNGSTINIYHFKTISNKNTSFIKEINAILIKIKSRNLMEGRILYPQPFSFSYYDPKNNRLYETKLIFIEKGDHKILINRHNNLDYILDSNSPSNIEYKNLKNQLKAYDEKLKPFQNNDSKNIDTKQNFLQKYIIRQPNSYVAFWEIVNDFSKFGFTKSYLKSLSLFSQSVKKAFSFIEFKKIIDIENSTNIGGNFPDVSFNSNDKIVKSDFSNYQVTVIDYWATFCKPCIQDLPKLVELYEKYKNKGVNFISVTDENKIERIELATKILENNKVGWKNYFDVNKEFPKKLNASGYPLQILVDRNGKIIARKLGELDQIESEIKKNLE